MGSERASKVMRVGLLVMAVSALPLGAWAVVAPRSFYDDFPGFGRHWVAQDGPFNEHLVRDFGALNLALALFTVCAAIWLTRAMAVTAALAWLVYGVPHLAYHLGNLDPYDTADQVGILGGLLLAPVVACVVLVAARALPRPD